MNYLSSSSSIFESFDSDVEINFRIFTSDSSSLSTLRRKYNLLKNKDKIKLLSVSLYTSTKNTKKEDSNLFSSSSIFSSFNFKA